MSDVVQFPQSKQVSSQFDILIQTIRDQTPEAQKDLALQVLMGLGPDGMLSTFGQMIIATSARPSAGPLREFGHRCCAFAAYLEAYGEDVDISRAYEIWSSTS